MNFSKYGRLATNLFDDEDGEFEEVVKGRRKSPQDPESRSIASNSPSLAKQSARFRSQPTAQRSLSSFSVSLTSLGANERMFISLVAEGKVSAVQKFLAENPKTDINVRDIYDIGALHRAVRSENKRMVNYLINLPNFHIGDTILYAVQLGNTDVTVLLLDRLSELDPELESARVESNVFEPDITPLILAAHLNDYNMVKLLETRGHMIPRPHPPGCLCGRPQCVGKMLEHSKERFNAYKAVSSSAYISLFKQDYIKYCFKMCNELYNCSSQEPEIGEHYEELAEELKKFPILLLEECNETREVELILQQAYPGAPARALYPRIYHGLQSKQKKFIAHENCQRILRTAYLDDWHDWKGMSLPGQLFRVLYKSGFFPLFAIFYIVLPIQPEFMKKWMHPPIHRHIIATVSYLAFLVLLFLETAHDHDRSYRGAPRSGLEPFIAIYVISHAYYLLRHASFFTSSWWNWYDGMNIILFLATFVVWIVAAERAKNLPELDRMEWDWNEPVLIGESLFGFSTILAFGKLFQIFRVNRLIGPLLISLGKISVDISKFFMVYLCLILSFSTGLNHLYEAYANQTLANHGTNKTQNGAFMTFASTAFSLFWTLFGLIPLEVSEVVIGNHYENGSIWKDKPLREHTFTQSSGFIIFGLYMLVAVLVLLNTLIAVISSSFEKVVDNSDIEWKFARTQIWVEYFDNDNLLPPPFNIIPPVHSLVGRVRSILSRDKIDSKESKKTEASAQEYKQMLQRSSKAIFSRIQREKKNII